MPAKAPPEPVVRVKLTAHCETRQFSEVTIPAEEEALLVLLNAEQPMIVEAVLVEMPAVPAFVLATQAFSAAPLPTVKPLSALPAAAQPLKVQALLKVNPVPPLLPEVQFVSTQ